MIGRRAWRVGVAVGLLAATTALASAQTAPHDATAPAGPVEPAAQDAGGERVVDAVSTPFLVDAAGPSAGCAIAAYAQCLGVDRAGCEQLTQAAADAANVEIEAEAAKVSPERAASPFFEGVAIGIFVRHMERLTDGRFLDCAPRAR